MITAVQTLFGRTVQGDDVTRTVLTNSRGTEVALLNYGAIIQSIKTPDIHGQTDQYRPVMRHPRRLSEPTHLSWVVLPVVVPTA